MKIKLLSLLICTTYLIACNDESNANITKPTSTVELTPQTTEQKPTKPTADNTEKNTSESTKPKEKANQLNYSFDAKALFNKTSKMSIDDQFTDYKDYVAKVKLPKTLTVKEDKNTFSDEGETWTEAKLVVLDKKEVLFDLNYAEQPQSKKMRVESITIHSPSIKNADGIGVGTNVTEFLRTYPSAKLYYTYISDEMWLSDRDFGNKFIIKVDDRLIQTLNVNADLITVDPKILPKSQRIESIIIREAPGFGGYSKVE